MKLFELAKKLIETNNDDFNVFIHWTPENEVIEVKSVHSGYSIRERISNSQATEIDRIRANKREELKRIKDQDFINSIKRSLNMS